AGAGVAPHDVAELVRVFEPIADIMRKLAGQGMRGRVQMLQTLMRQAATNPEAMLSKPKVGTGKRLRPEEKARLKKLREKELRRRRKEQRRGG
ncbi:MAG TPA: signal recognition particle protein, partial [Thermogutta sp.]|nr:signal recognition particle protein [Thermogutta sp.]